ncbi:hypothetical protein WA588_001424, partial [Blastocystis sp. NMH]
MRSTTSPSPHIPRFSPTPPSPTRAFVQKTLRFGSYLCELCSFLVLGMITYNLHPFAIDKRWLLLFVLVIYLVRYASVTGVMATAVHWLEGDKHHLINHNHVAVLFFVYRGTVSFTLAARAEGELVDNSQVTLMMKLALCMIWISIFQHLLLSIPFAGLRDAKRTLIEGSESGDDEVEKETAVQWVNDWLYCRLVIPKREEEDEGIGLELSESEKE